MHVLAPVLTGLKFLVWNFNTKIFVFNLTYRRILLFLARNPKHILCLALLVEVCTYRRLSSPNQFNYLKYRDPNTFNTANILHKPLW